MKYPKDFEKYWKRAQHNVNFNATDIRGLDTSVKRIAFNAWRNGKKVKDEELWRARSNGAFAYHFDEKIKEAVDKATQRAYDDLLLYMAQRCDHHWAEHLVDDDYV